MPSEEQRDSTTVASSDLPSMVLTIILARTQALSGNGAFRMIHED
ncbi:MAG: hypothetical protein M0Z84_04655 [Gammaproteobacteria bacterium]|nr:hypothetical protein [Gammaproteobacteria bacterium]